MKLEIIKQKEALLLSRAEITASVTFEKETPSRMQIRDSVAAKLSVGPECVVIKHIYQKYGGKSAKIIANVYKDQKVKEHIEEKVLLAKQSAKKESEEAESQVNDDEEKAEKAGKEVKSKKDNAKKDNAKKDDAKKDNAKKDDAKRDNAKKDDVKKD